MNLKEAKHLIEAWRDEYNQNCPHASLEDRTPSEFANQYAATVGCLLLAALFVFHEMLSDEPIGSSQDGI